MVLDDARARATHDTRELVAEWYTRWQTPLYRYLVRLLHDPERAADVLQDTFVRALIMLDRQAVPDNPQAWLYRTATNLAFNVLRRRRLLRWLPFTGDEPAPAFESGVATAALVRQCLARLKPKHAETLLLYEWAGLTCIEIAAQTGDDVGAIRVRLHRARTHFARLYEQEIADEL